jgi:UDP-N-acetylglucosamine--N-acetylmuramyl-(pentapeptide) pyrophosphoryl-undecaprenol N-acetylglucosamine transferase
MKLAPCALIMAGGTGGHIFPGLALAQVLRERGWRVHWLGVPASMESRLVPPKGFAFEPVDFSGVRGKGVKSLLLLPLRLARALWQCMQVVRRVRPDVLVGFGGYVTVPGGLMGVLLRKPLVLHEQNSVAGTANRLLARWASRVFTAFPKVLPQGEWVGNPLRAEFMQQAAPEARFAGRTGPLQVLVVGGSLGASALNSVVPQALALLPEVQRPVVTHQSGEKQLDALKTYYAAAGVTATLTPFIDNTAQAFANADLVIGRAGASTVTELAAVGAASVLVPFPAAIDDHQTHNARFLADHGAAWLVPQSRLTPEGLADLLLKSERSTLLACALQAKQLQKLDAATHMADACAEVAS